MDKIVGFLESELERVVAERGAPARDDNVVALGAARDHDTLRERERRFRDLLGSLPAAIYTTDAKGRIT